MFCSCCLFSFLFPSRFCSLKRSLRFSFILVCFRSFIIFLCVLCPFVFFSFLFFCVIYLAFLFFSVRHLHPKVITKTSQNPPKTSSNEHLGSLCDPSWDSWCTGSNFYSIFIDFWSPLGALWAPILLTFRHFFHHIFRRIFRHLPEPYFPLFFIDFRLLFELFWEPGGKVISMLSLQREHRNHTLAPSKMHTFSGTVPGPPFLRFLSLSGTLLASIWTLRDHFFRDFF